jgi:micrococcal nuclease
VRVRRVIDGDTVELSGGRLVRYLGIDTPEVRRQSGDRWVRDPEPFGEQATEANRRMVERKTVRLEYDVQTHDRFGRLLAYVYVPAAEAGFSGAGELFVNEELLRLGVARPLTIPPNVKHAERFRAITEEARHAGRGLWGTR